MLSGLGLLLGRAARPEPMDASISREALTTVSLRENHGERKANQIVARRNIAAPANTPGREVS